jgi:ribosomal protein S18 acetylase RimI-like enzyme
MPRVALADLLGRRVVVRRVAERSPAGARYADVVGVLVTADPDRLAVRRADGSVQAVDLPDVHRVRQVPPSVADVLALEEVAALGWPALDVRWLGRWLLRAAHGWTGRANSVLPLGDPGLPLDSALAEVAGWYRQRDLLARFQVPLPARAGLDDALAERGWTGYNLTAVLTADVPMTLAALPARADLPPVTLDPTPSAAWLSAYHYRGGGELPDFAVRLMTGAEQPVFASVVDGAVVDGAVVDSSVAGDGAVLGIARGVLDRGWLGVTAVEVAPAARRQGLATHLMRALLDWAAERRATAAYLQVAEENAAGLAFYLRLRFARHHQYRYRLAPEEDS